jgi:hypothetical protein
MREKKMVAPTEHNRWPKLIQMRLAQANSVWMNAVLCYWLYLAISCIMYRMFGFALPPCVRGVPHNRPCW